VYVRAQNDAFYKKLEAEEKLRVESAELQELFDEMDREKRKASVL
jgi:hypothetical protein